VSENRRTRLRAARVRAVLSLWLAGPLLLLAGSAHPEATARPPTSRRDLPGAAVLVRGPEPAVRTLTLRRGGTLGGMLLGAGIARAQAHEAIVAVRDVFDPRALRAGDRVTLTFGGTRADGHRTLRSLHLETARHQDVTLVAHEDGSFGRPAPPGGAYWSLEVVRRSGTVDGSFRRSLARADLPEAVIDEALDAFAYDPDLPADPPGGSRFTVVYERAEGRGADPGAVRLRSAALRSDAGEQRVYRYQTAGGDVAFIDPSGRGVVPIRLLTPVHHVRITSPWGWRIHPVLGVRLFHKGVDFGAPVGTPVYAASDGVVELIGWRGNYGRYVRLRHSGRVETAYAHLSRFAPGLHPGSRVRSGQVIAYVGASGLATGPHLYYEVLIDRHQVNPQQEALALPIQLAGHRLNRFHAYVEQVASEQVASATPGR
jgi:murein DD-endopeptidase MepM/ murein hydrolase activator NlpD